MNKHSGSDAKSVEGTRRLPAGGGAGTSRYSRNEFRAAWTEPIRGSLCIGVEVVEYNPYRDRADRTARLIGGLIATMVSEEFESH